MVVGEEMRREYLDGLKVVLNLNKKMRKDMKVGLYNEGLSLE